MRDQAKTKDQLIDELVALRKRNADLEESRNSYKKAGEKLKSSEERLRILFEYAPDGYYLNDFKGNFVDGNRAAEELTGYTRDELIGKNFLKLKLLSPKDFPKAAASLAKNALGQPTGPDEFTLNRKDGTQVEVEVRTFPVKIKGQTLVLSNVHDITKRKQAEEALRESEEKLRIMFDSIRNGIVVTDMEANITDVNNATLRMGGYSHKEELIGRNAIDFVSPNDRAMAMENLSKELEIGHSTEDVEYALLAADGSEFDIESNATVLCDSSGNPVGLINVIRDITERKQAEDALRTSEEKFSKAFRNNPDSLYITTIPEGKFVNVNPAFEKISGYSKDEVLGKTALELDFYISPDDRVKLMQQLQKDGRLHDYDISFRIKSGEIRLCRVFSEVIEIQEKPHLLSIVRDITEQKKAEDELRSSEEGLKILFKYAPDAYYLSDLKGNFIDGNLAAEDLLGYKKSELIGKRFLKLKLLSAKEISKAAKLLAKNTLGKGTGPDEFTLHRKDGTTVITEIRTYPVKIKEQTLVLGIARDITERKHTEEALQREKDKAQKYLDIAGVMFIVLNVKGEVVLINQKGSEVLGCEQKEIMGKNWFDNFLPPSMKEEVKTVFNRLMVSKIEPVEYYENPVLTKGGEERIIAWHNTTLQDDEGNIIGTLSSGEDITKRKRAEVQIRTEKEFTETALDAQLDTFFLFEPSTGKAVRWNRSFNDITGYTDEEIARMPAPTSYYSSEDLELAGPFIQNVLEEGTGTIELELICKDDRKIPTEYRVSVINDELGEPKFIISIGRDITERKQAEEELQKLASVVHYSSELVNLAFLDGKMIFLNEAGSKMLGIDPKAVEKHIIMEVIPEHLVDLVTNELLPALIKQGKWEGELQYRNIKTGGLTDVHAMCFTVKDPKTGTPKYLANVSLDITERKEAEQVIEKSYNRLQSLAQKVFKAQEEERQRVSRELHDESGGMLTALNLKLDLISTELPPGQKTTRAQLADAKELVNQTMDGLRSLALGLRPLALDSFGLETTMEDLCRDFGNRTGLHIDYHAAPIPDLSEIVQITLYRFLQEGLTNITKHGQANRVKVRFQHEAPVVILSVEDDGIGFDPATKSQGGMGLESMDERLELVGGHLEIHSQLGEGTRLTASIPIDEMTADPE